MLRNKTKRDRLNKALAATAVLSGLGLLSSGAKADPGDQAFYQYGDYGYKIANMLDIDQRRDWNFQTGVIGLPNQGSQYCVPTACTNLLGYVANHGYSFITPGPNNWQSNSVGVYNAMSIDLLNLGGEMNTDPSKGTTGGNAYNAMLNHLPSVLFSVDMLYSNKTYCPRFQDLALLAISGRLVNVQVGWYSFADIPYMIHARTGGHYVTLTSADSPAVNPALMGINDPANDKYLYAQSAFQTDSYYINDQFGLFADKNYNNVYPRTLSRITGYGSGYIDGAMLITPKFGLVASQSSFKHHKPVKLVNRENAKLTEEFRSMTGGSIMDFAYDPISVKVPYLIEGQNALFELNLITGESSLLPAVQTDPNGAPSPFALNGPKRLVIGGPDRNIYLLESDRLICLSRDGAVQKIVPLRQSLRGLVFSAKWGRLVAFAPDTQEIYQFSPTLDLLSVDKLTVPFSPRFRVSLTDDPRTGDVLVLGDGSVDVLRLHYNDAGLLQMVKFSLQGAMFPQGLDIDEAGNLLVNDQGLLVCYDLNGRKAGNSPFLGLPGGQMNHVIRSFTNFDPAQHATPSYYNVLPDDPSIR